MNRLTRYLLAGIVTTVLIAGVITVFWASDGGVTPSALMRLLAIAAAVGIGITLCVFVPITLVVRAVSRKRATRLWLPPVLVAGVIGFGMALLIHLTHRLPEPHAERAFLIVGLFLGVLQLVFGWLSEAPLDRQRYAPDREPLARQR